MVEDETGEQRHTLYAHFPDERSLFLACSGLSMERDPLPDPAPWLAIADRRERLRIGLLALYGWYDRNAALAACVLRDAEHHALTREMIELRMGPTMTAYGQVLGGQVLGGELQPGEAAMLHLALSFCTWRTLVREAGLQPAVAVDAMVRAVEGAG
jgi:hypothetical protein